MFHTRFQAWVKKKKGMGDEKTNTFIGSCGSLENLYPISDN